MDKEYKNLKSIVKKMNEKNKNSFIRIKKKGPMMYEIFIDSRGNNNY